MALISAVAAPAPYQSSAYRELVRGLKLSSAATTTLITLTGASLAAMQPAAATLASELGRSLYRIDLSRVVSKFIGETEKNLSRVFAGAESSNWVLFFDEADALFGKRTTVNDSHDRYADHEMSHLTTVLARFGGVIVAPLTHPVPQITTRARLRHVRVTFPPDRLRHIR